MMTSMVNITNSMHRLHFIFKRYHYRHSSSSSLMHINSNNCNSSINDYNRCFSTYRTSQRNTNNSDNTTTNNSNNSNNDNYGENRPNKPKFKRFNNNTRQEIVTPSIIKITSSTKYYDLFTNDKDNNPPIVPNSAAKVPKSYQRDHQQEQRQEKKTPLIEKLVAANPQSWSYVQKNMTKRNMNELEQIAGICKMAHFNDYPIQIYAPDIAEVLRTDVKAPIGAEEFANIFSAMADLRIRDVHSLGILSLLMERMQYLKAPLTANNIRMSSRGLYSMRAKYSDVKVVLKKFTQLIQDSPEDWSFKNIGTTVAHCFSLSCEFEEVRSLIDVLTRRLECLTPTAVPSSLVASVLKGLNCMHSSTPEVNRLLKALIPYLELMEASFTMVDLANGVHGLRFMKSDDSTVQALLAGIVSRMPTPDNSALRESQLRILMSGTRSWNSDVPVVRSFVGRLAELLPPSCTKPLKPITSSTVLFGLENMSTTSPEVVSFLTATTPAIRKCDEKWTTMEIAQACYGLRRMSSDENIVKLLIHFLTEKIGQLQEPFKLVNLSKAVDGITSFSPNEQMVQYLFAALNDHLSQPAYREFAVDRSIIVNVLRVFHNMEYLFPVCNKLLETFSPMIERCTEVLTGEDIAYALGTLHKVKRSRSVVKHLIALFTPFVQSGGVMTAQQIATSLFALSELDNRNTAGILAILEALHKRALQCEENMTLKQIEQCVSGISSMDISSPIVSSFLRLIARNLKSIASDAAYRDTCSVIDQQLEKMIRESGYLDAEARQVVDDIHLSLIRIDGKL